MGVNDFSVRMINGGANSAAGSWWNAWANSIRLVNRDPFWMSWKP